MKGALQPLFSLAFFLISFPLLVWGFWPPRRETVTAPLTLLAGMPSLPEGRTIRLTYSPTMRAGDSQVVELSVTSEEDATDDSVYEEYIVIIEARLDLPLADVRPAQPVSAALAKGGGATFYWEATPREEEVLRGTIWLYLRFVPKAGGEEARQPVSAQLVEIRTRSILKRTGAEARSLGVIGFVVGMGFGVLILWKGRASAL